MAAFLRERLLEMSDPYECYVCKPCGKIAASTTVCHICGQETLEKIALPFAFKLLLYEIQALGIKTKLNFSE